MKTILYFQYPWAKWRERLAGVYRYAIGRRWQIVMVEWERTFTTVKEAIRFWNPDGCLVEWDCSTCPSFDRRDLGSIPSVYFDASRSQVTDRHFGVIHDSVQTAMLGVKELLDLGFDDYAYIPYFRPREWSDRRCEVMRKMVAAAGRRLSVFAGGGCDAGNYVKSLKPFLHALPKPCGVFVANDAVGALVLGVCRQLRIRVPDCLSVLGVDDDELICQNTRPKLSSVKPDFEESGYLAAKLLDECLSHKLTDGKILRFGPKLVVRRDSTCRFGRRDIDASRGLAFIRENLATGIGAIDVIREIGGSRRSAEKRFLRLTGHSIGAEITAQRLTRAKQLLLKRSVPIGEIYSLCGYSNPETLRRAFMLATGCSLRAWRDSGK